MAEQCNTMKTTPGQQSNEPMSAVEAALEIAEIQRKSKDGMLSDDYQRECLLYDNIDTNPLVILAAEVRRLRSALNMSEIALAATHELVSKLREQTRWQPIDENPYFNETILYNGVKIFIGKFEGKTYRIFERGFGWVAVFPQPTHFMPLPAAPESGEKGGAA